MTRGNGCWQKRGSSRHKTVVLSCPARGRPTKRHEIEIGCHPERSEGSAVAFRRQLTEANSTPADALEGPVLRDYSRFPNRRGVTLNLRLVLFRFGSLPGPGNRRRLLHRLCRRRPLEERRPV